MSSPSAAGQSGIEAVNVSPVVNPDDALDLNGPVVRAGSDEILAGDVLGLLHELLHGAVAKDVSQNAESLRGGADVGGNV